MTLHRLLSVVVALAALSLSTPYLEESSSFARGRDSVAPAARPRESVAPTVLALELGRMGGDTLHDLPQQRLGGDSERVFGPVHPSSRLGRYTGKHLGSYTGSGLGGYGGGGLGNTSTFGTGSATGGQTADERFR